MSASWRSARFVVVDLVFLALATHMEARGRGTVGALLRADRSVRVYRMWHPRRVRSG